MSHEIKLLDLYKFRIEIFCENFRFVKKIVKKMLKFSQNFSTFWFIRCITNPTPNESFQIRQQYSAFYGLRRKC
jgi:hypothetical protein